MIIIQLYNFFDTFKLIFQLLVVNPLVSYRVAPFALATRKEQRGS